MRLFELSCDLRALGLRAALAATMLTVPVACASVLGVHRGGFNMISLEQEWEMRDELRRQVRQEYDLLDDSRVTGYVSRIGRRLVAQTELADLPWTFGVVRDDAVNAFNLPGGLVYVNTGLIAQADSLDQLTAVLGHEIAHGVARHGTQLMTRAQGLGVLTSVVLGEDPGQLERTLAGLVGSGILLDYSRDAEREADRLGVRYNHAAGYDPHGAPEFFRKLLELRQSRPSDLARFFSSHPITEERIRTTRKIADSLPDHGSLVHDSREYQRMRGRI